MRTHFARSNRRGFTLAEMIIAVTMLSMFGASAITFYLRSLRSVTNTAGRNDAQQNATYALDFIDHDLRIAGTGLAPSQSLLVEANGRAVAFNGDLITHDTTATAPGTYYDPSVDDSVVLAWQQSRAGALPLTNIAYPESTYYANGGATGPIGGAETIQFWVASDTTNPLPNRYKLWRRVNNNSPVVVAENIYLATPTTPVFQYWRTQTAAPGAGVNSNALVPLTAAQVPLYHVRNDTVQQNKLNNIRAVRVTLTSAYRDPQRNVDVLRTVNEQIEMPNAGATNVNQCGGSPGAPAGLSATPSAGGQDTVGLSWTNSADDGAGRNTVRMYLIYRKLHADSLYAPMFSVTATGVGTYNYSDTQVTLGQSYDYSLAARDCTPSLSSFVTATNVTPN